MKYLEMLAEEIKKQKKIDRLMEVKREKLAELKDIDHALRKLVLRTRSK